MSELAFYHRKGWKARAMTVAVRHENGTVDLADADGAVVVTACPVVAPGADLDGVCTLAAPLDVTDGPDEPEGAKPKKPKKGEK